MLEAGPEYMASGSRFRVEFIGPLPISIRGMLNPLIIQEPVVGTEGSYSWAWPSVYSIESANRVKMYGVWAYVVTGIATLLANLISLNQDWGFLGAHASAGSFLGIVLIFGTAYGIYRNSRLPACVAVLWHVAGKFYQISQFSHTISEFSNIIFFVVLWCLVMSIRALLSLHSIASPTIIVSTMLDSPVQVDQNITENVKVEIKKDTSIQDLSKISIINIHKGWIRVWIIISLCTIGWAGYHGYSAMDGVKTYNRLIENYTRMIDKDESDERIEKNELYQHYRIFKENKKWHEEQDKLLTIIG